MPYMRFIKRKTKLRTYARNQTKALIKKRTPIRHKRLADKAKDMHNPFGHYWRQMAYDKIMNMFRGKPCVMTGQTEGTVGHHILHKSTHPWFICVPENIAPLSAPWHRDVHDFPEKNKEFMDKLAQVDKTKAIWVWAHRTSKGGVRINWKDIYESLVYDEAIEKGLYE